MNTEKPPKSAPLNVMTGIAVVACVLCIVGALLPWANVTTPILAEMAGEASVVGTDTPDGKLVIGLAFAALAIVVAFRFARKRWLAVVALLLGSAIAAIGIADSANLEVFENEFGGDLFGLVLISAGPGLYVVILGGLALAAAAVYLAVTARRGRRDVEPPDDDSASS